MTLYINDLLQCSCLTSECMTAGNLCYWCSTQYAMSCLTSSVNNKAENTFNKVFFSYLLLMFSNFGNLLTFGLHPGN